MDSDNASAVKSGLAIITVIASLSMAGTGLSIAGPENKVITLSHMLSYARTSGKLKEMHNNILSQRQEIQVLKSESSAIFQGRVKAGYYTRFSYDGYPRNEVAKPKIGFKYYLFGGNKYMRHIMDEAQPKYFQYVSQYNSILLRKKKQISALYLRYWSQREKKLLFREFIKENSIINKLAKKLGTACNRMQLEVYLANMRSHIYINKMDTILDKNLPVFQPVLPKNQLKNNESARLDGKSILAQHPGISGLIQYYHEQKKLGWLRFIDVKLKGFIRPSYYPGAGRTKWSVIGGVYVNMPIDILGAVKHEDARLALKRENILIRLQDDQFQAKNNTRTRKLRTPVFEHEIAFWRQRMKLVKEKVSDLSRKKGSLSRKVSHLAQIYSREYRTAVSNFVKYTRKLYVIALGF